MKGVRLTENLHRKTSLIGSFVMTFAFAIIANAVEAPYCLPPEDEGDRSPSSVKKEAIADNPFMKPPPPNWNGVTLIRMYDNVDLSEAAKDGFEIREFDEVAVRDPWTEPSPKLRDDLFRAAELERIVKSWSQMDRDFLFLRAQEYPLKRLKTKYYPKMPVSYLEALQHVIRLRKKAEARR